MLLAALQPAFDLAQRMRPPQLAEQHGDELAQLENPFAACSAPLCLTKRSNSTSWNQLEDLAEHAA
ncbi:MAG: hypothetical protein U1E63_15270 [Burkholderiales bacterium]